MLMPEEKNAVLMDEFVDVTTAAVVLFEEFAAAAVAAADFLSQMTHWPVLPFLQMEVMQGTKMWM